MFFVCRALTPVVRHSIPEDHTQEIGIPSHSGTGVSADLIFVASASRMFSEDECFRWMRRLFSEAGDGQPFPHMSVWLVNVCLQEDSVAAAAYHSTRSLFTAFCREQRCTHREH